MASDTVQHPLGDIGTLYQKELANVNVTTLRFRGSWNVVQPSSSTYNWAKIDEAFQDAKDHNKRIGLSIAAGLSTPQWVYDSGVTKYALHDGSGNMPLPWEQKFQDAFTTFVRAVSDRYSGSSVLAYVLITGFMQENAMYLGDTTDEANMPHIGFPDVHTAYVDAAKKITAIWLSKFPTTTAMLMTTRPFPDDAGLTDQNTVKDWALATYPKRLGIMAGNGLKATVAPHASPPPITFPKGAQSIFPATGNCPAIYLSPAPQPCPPDPQPLKDLLENAWSLGNMFVETYKPDIESTVTQGVLSDESKKLSGNQPK